MRRPANLEATSQLELGAKGVFEGEPFTLAGRRCIQGARGQIWNEWTLGFERERERVFLAESYGSLTVFREGSLLPSFTEVNVGMALPWLVVERGTATRLAKWGDLEEARESYDYVDLSYQGMPEKSASVADDETFIGTPADAASLGLTLRDRPPVLVPAPNVSLPAGIDLWLDVGDAGVLEGVAYRVIGITARRTPTAEPTRWQDYLLYNAHIGLRWLGVADGHWTYAVPIEVGPHGFDGLEEATPAVLEWAAGELPWSPEIGEVAMVYERGDVVFEHTFIDVSASRTHPLSPDVVAKAFRKRALPRPK